MTIPAGTALRIDLRTSVGSDTSRLEQRVTAALRAPVSVRGAQALPTGTRLVGHVTSVERAGRVKGRGRVAFRFTSLDVPSRASSSMFTTGHAVCGAPARSLKVPLAVKALAIPERLVTPVACTSARVGARSETKAALRALRRWQVDRGKLLKHRLAITLLNQGHPFTGRAAPAT